ncbi:MAG: AzlC family ABC transporter permease [Oscillospiraceae bacterium]|nr:AzlC family ABC transporter permease [Oscillospiraceae bacterium]
MSSGKWYLKGLRDGIPIMLGYFAVSLALGIAARNAGLSALQAALASLTNNASAGEYVGFTLIAAGASYTEMFVMEAIANARYLLMSTALSQRLSAAVPFVQRLLLGFMVTDEIFGVSISVEGHVRPSYPYGLFTVATFGWTLGTFLGVLLGNILPLRVVSALSVSLYGMFIAIFIPPARKDKVVAVLVVLSFLTSWAFSSFGPFAALSSGLRTIILTVALSLGAALLFPVKDKEESADA